MGTVCVAAEISQRHHFWLVWNDRPIAVRGQAIRRTPARDDGTYAVTVIGSTWAELDELLTEQEANDAAHLAMTA
jgi:hypothetical protein